MRYKKGLEKIKMNYTKVPSKIFKMNLSSGALALYCYLANLPEEIDPSKAYISSKFNVSRPTVLKWYKELLMVNIIECYRSGGLNKVSKYAFVHPKKWKEI